ncbi:MAG: alpha amylase C-terminal domain-containing protein, partial [Desulfobacteraceae bacterium]|nr:alpha amylase C-terminal domain-containing protein [Desulfobacteraceae bacterium]
SKLGDFDLKMIEFAKNFINYKTSSPELVFIHEQDRVLIFKRNNLIFAFNFNSINSFSDYTFNATPGKYKMVFNTDMPGFGGKDRLYSDQVHFTIADSKLSLYLPTRTAQIIALENETKISNKTQE